MIRKPDESEQVHDSFINCPLETARILTSEELGVEDYTLAKFKLVTPKIFILVRGNKKYVVDTEGYNYIKYIQRIA